MAESEDHIQYRTHSQRHLKRSKNESAVAFVREILNTLLENTEIFIKIFNIISKHLKSSHSENGGTHSTIICCLSKSNLYSCLDIIRQEKENAIATVTSTRKSRSTSSLSHRSITSHQSWHSTKNASLFLHSLSFHNFMSHSHHSSKTSLQLDSSILQSSIIQIMSNVLSANWSLADGNHTIMSLQSTSAAHLDVNHHIHHCCKALNHQVRLLQMWLKRRLKRKKFLHQRISKKRNLHQRISVFLILHCSITSQSFAYIMMWTYSWTRFRVINITKQTLYS